MKNAASGMWYLSEQTQKEMQENRIPQNTMDDCTAEDMDLAKMAKTPSTVWSLACDEASTEEDRNHGVAIDSDCFGVGFCHSIALEQKLKEMGKYRSRMESALEAEIMLKRKEMEIRLATMKKRVLLERQMREEDEEQEHLLQKQILQERRLQLNRMKARRAFEDCLKSMNGEKDMLKRLRRSKEECDSEEDGEEEECYEDLDKRKTKRWKDVRGGKTKNKPDNLREHGPGQRQIKPTKLQLAARSGISKKLPIFSGKPEEWPLFYGAFQASNEACGYSDVENLVRLQDCIKGPALELVRGQLLLPKSVPKVVEKLRQLYGRPEQLLQYHLNKLRNLRAPNADNLASFIPFGTAVEQLCEHLEAAEMKPHLINPLLIHLKML